MTDWIKKWCDENNALSRTLEIFWECFENYSNEHYEEYITVFPDGKDNVIAKFDRISYQLDLPDFSRELIAIIMDIYIGEEIVGWFKPLYLLNGELDDVYFVIE